MSRASVLGLSVVVSFMFACGDDTTSADSGPLDGAVHDGSLDASTSPHGVVGSTCVEDADCLAGLSCYTGPDGARAWPGGYCTRDCSSALDCPGSSTCGIAYIDVDGTTRNLCQATCTREAGTRGGCREGYECGWQGFCTIGCSSDDECHTDDTWPGPPRYEPSARCELSSSRCLHGTHPEAQDGDACVSNTDCRGPAGRCLLNVCVSTQCDLGGELSCADTQQCVGIAAGFDSWSTFCATTCRVGVDGLDGTAPDDRCPPGFMCAPPESDPSGRATEPFCTFRVVGVGTSATATVGSHCTTEADCPLALGYSWCIDSTCLAQFCAAPSLAGQDVCGPGATCFAPAGDRARLGWQSEQLALGLCVRDCSADASVCVAPTSCTDSTYCFSGTP